MDVLWDKIDEGCFVCRGYLVEVLRWTSAIHTCRWSWLYSLQYWRVSCIPKIYNYNNEDILLLYHAILYCDYSSHCKGKAFYSILIHWDPYHIVITWNLQTELFGSNQCCWYFAINLCRIQHRSVYVFHKDKKAAPITSKCSCQQYHVVIHYPSVLFAVKSWGWWCPYDAIIKRTWSDASYCPDGYIKRDTIYSWVYDVSNVHGNRFYLIAYKDQVSQWRPWW